MDDSEFISVEETNQLRISLGLKPLSTAPSTAIDPLLPTPEENFALHKQNLAKTSKTTALKNTLDKKKIRDKLALKIVGRSLADSDDDDVEESALDWINRVKKNSLSSEIKKKKDKTNKRIEYEAKDLKGLKIAHSINDLDDENQILVLDDFNVLDEMGELDGEDEDRLVSIDTQVKVNQRKNNMKKLGKKYKGYEDENELNDEKKALLYQYDNESDDDFMVLGDEGKIKSKLNPLDPANKNQIGESLLFENQNFNKQILTDYYSKEEIAEENNKTVSFKKKKKSKKSKRIRTSLLDEEEGMEKGESHIPSPIEETQSFNFSNSNRDIKDMNFVDDDDLQAVLDAARKTALRKRDDDDIKDSNPLESEDEEMEETGGLIITSTTEFAQNLNITREETPKQTIPIIKEEEEEEDVWEKTNPDNMQIDAAEEEEEEEKEDGEQEDTVEDLIDEPLVSTGMAATLALLNRQRLIENPSQETLKLEKNQIQKRKWLVEQRKKDLLLEMQRNKDKVDLDDDSSHHQQQKKRKGKRGGVDWVDPAILEQQRLKESLERMKDYIPDVNLNYYDDKGRALTSKEAYKLMCHKFHGKGSGKMKTEKRLKKVQDEQNLKNTSSVDTPLQTAAAFEKKSKARGSAHIVMSTGNKDRVVVYNDAPLSSSGVFRDVQKKDYEDGVAYEEKAVHVVDVTTNAPILQDRREKISFGFSLKRKAE